MRRLYRHLTYPDLAGRGRPRRYAAAGLLLLGLALAIYGGALYQGEKARTVVQADPQSAAGLSVEAAGHPDPLDGAAAPRADSPGRLPVGESSAAASSASEPCPPDPAAWTLVEVLPGDQYKRITPACVYDGLARTVAWHLLERLGYPKGEAAGLLGFAEPPWQPAETVTALTNTAGPLELPLVIEWPAHPAYRFWAVTAQGEPGPAYSLRGCHRTRTIVGERVERWNPAYAVLCVVAVDYSTGWSVSALDEHLYAHDSTTEPGTRAFLLFGYTDGHAWVFVGERANLYLPMEDPAAMAAERARLSARFGAEPWDAAWLAQTYALTMRPLPEGWQEASDPAAMAAIGAALNSWLEP